MKAARRYIVKGQVQGVNYRSFTETCALALQISGWVRNLPDGSVEVFAEGTPEQLREFAFDLSRGSRYARVHSVKGEDAALENLASFEVRR